MRLCLSSLANIYSGRNITTHNSQVKATALRAPAHYNER